jgi:hypothetical protein
MLLLDRLRRIFDIFTAPASKPTLPPRVGAAPVTMARGQFCEMGRSCELGSLPGGVSRLSGAAVKHWGKPPSKGADAKQTAFELLFAELVRDAAVARSGKGGGSSGGSSGGGGGGGGGSADADDGGGVAAASEGAKSAKGAGVPQPAAAAATAPTAAPPPPSGGLSCDAFIDAMVEVALRMFPPGTPATAEADDGSSAAAASVRSLVEHMERARQRDRANPKRR